MGLRASDYIDYDIIEAVPVEQKIKKQIILDEKTYTHWKLCE